MKIIRFNPVLRALFLCGVVCHIPLALAQEDDVGEISLGDLLNVNAEVWSVSRSDQKARKAPATAVVVSQQQIKDRGYRDLNDVLRDLPGFDLLENAGRFGELYTIRGIDGNDRFLVLVDGHRINPYRGTFLSTGHSLSVRFAEQVEVVYGPASVVFGADAFSAIINIVTKTKDNPSEGTFSAYAGVGDDGTSDTSFSGKLPFANGDGLLSVSARLFDSDGVDLSGRDVIYPSSVEYAQPEEDRNINIKFNYGEFELGYFQQYFNEGNGIPQNPAIYRHDSTGIWRMTTDILWGSYSWSLNENSELNFDLSYTEHIQHPDSNFPKTPPQYFTGEDETIKASAVLSHTFGDGYHLVAGLETENSDSIPPYANDEVFGTGNSVKFIGADAELIRSQLSLEETRWAGFAQLTIPLSEQFTAFAGIRYDYSDVNDNSTNPRGGLVYEPSDKTTVKFLYGTAFQAPSLFFQYEQFIVPPIKLIMIPNTELKNQELTSYEMSVAHRISEKYMFNASVYYNDLTDLIFRGLSSQTVAGYNTVLQNINIGTQTAQGLDMRLDAVIDENTTAYFNYSYIDAEFELNGSTLDLARVSENKINLGITTTLFENLSVTAQVKYVGESTTAPTNNKYTNGAKIPDYTELNAYIKYRLFDQISIFAKFNNILDEDIENGGLFGQSGVLAPTIYQPRFNYLFGFEGTF